MKFGGFKFMESAHIKDLLAHLRVVANPKDTMSWNRLLLLVPGSGGHLQQVQLPGAGGFDLAAGVKWLRNQRRPQELKDLRSSWKPWTPRPDLDDPHEPDPGLLRTPGQGPL